MGLFDKKTSTSQTSNVEGFQSTEELAQQRRKEQATQERGLVTASTQTTTEASDLASTVRLLSPEVQAQLNTVLPQLIQTIQGGGVVSPEARAIANENVGFAETIKSDALGTRDRIQANFAPLAAEATRQFETNTMRDINTMAQQVGSNLNSFTQQLIAEGREDLAVRIAQIAASLGLEGEKLQSQNLVSGFAAGSQAGADVRAGDLGMNDAVNNLVALVNVLKGGEQTTTAATTRGVDVTGRQETQETINKLIDALIGTQSDRVVQTAQSGQITGQSKSGRDLLDFLSLLDFGK